MILLHFLKGGEVVCSHLRWPTVNFHIANLLRFKPARERLISNELLTRFHQGHPARFPVSRETRESRSPEATYFPTLVPFFRNSPFRDAYPC